MPIEEITWSWESFYCQNFQRKKIVAEQLRIKRVDIDWELVISAFVQLICSHVCGHVIVSDNIYMDAIKEKQGIYLGTLWTRALYLITVTFATKAKGWTTSISMQKLTAVGFTDIEISRSVITCVMKGPSIKNTILAENHIFCISDSCSIYSDHHLYNNKEKYWHI